MISYLKGKVILANANVIIIENSGIGYEIIMTENDISKINLGSIIEVYILSSFSMYEGIKLYGFLSDEEKKLFELIKSTIPNTGNAKAMDYLNRIQRSVSDFKKAVIRGDEKMLKTIFGFTTKTSKKIIDFLRDKISDEAGNDIISQSHYNNYEAALNALLNLGYKSGEAKSAISEVISENREKKITLEDMIKFSIRKLSGR